MTGRTVLQLTALVIAGVLAGLDVIGGDAFLAFVAGAVLVPAPAADALYAAGRGSREDARQEDDHL